MLTGWTILHDFAGGTKFDLSVLFVCLIYVLQFILFMVFFVTVGAYRLCLRLVINYVVKFYPKAHELKLEKSGQKKRCYCPTALAVLSCLTENDRDLLDLMGTQLPIKMISIYL